jgi:hypothetical protein
MPDPSEPGPGIGRNRLNLGKLYNQISAWIELAVGAVIVLAVVVAALLVPWHSGTWPLVPALLGFFLLLGLIPVLGGLTSVRRLRRPGNVPAGVSQFANADQWNVKATLPPATAAADETLVDWMGPMSTEVGRGWVTRAMVGQSRETDHNPFNTLLVTTSQLIGILLTPEDLSGVEGGGMRGAITTAINQSNETTFDKTWQFAVANRSRWDQIVASATSQGLQAALADHLNFGLPYAEVESFSVSKRWVNEGLLFQLRDGRKVRCARNCSRNVVDRAARSLSPYLKQV